MQDTFSLANILVLVVISLSGESAQDCVCTGLRVRGEYCGTELNRRNATNQCLTNQIYFCGPNNADKAAVPLVACQDQTECDQKKTRFSGRARSRNTCLKRFKCMCPTDRGRGRHCGSQLTGDDCPANMVFRCRFGGTVWPRDVCPNGCSDGKCVGDAVESVPEIEDTEAEEIPENVEDEPIP